VSTGSGPLTVYQSVGGAHPRRSPSRKGLTPAQAERLREVQAVDEQFKRLGDLHRGQFVEVGREFAEAPALPKFLKLLMTAEKEALAGVHASTGRLVGKSSFVHARSPSLGHVTFSPWPRPSALKAKQGLTSSGRLCPPTSPMSCYLPLRPPLPRADDLRGRCAPSKQRPASLCT